MENFKKTKNQAKVIINIRMEITFLENLKKVKNVDLAKCYLRMVTYMKEYGKGD
jgi:hypothetical protein